MKGEMISDEMGWYSSVNIFGQEDARIGFECKLAPLRVVTPSGSALDSTSALAARHPYNHV